MMTSYYLRFRRRCRRITAIGNTVAIGRGGGGFLLLLLLLGQRIEEDILVASSVDGIVDDGIVASSVDAIR